MLSEGVALAKGSGVLVASASGVLSASEPPVPGKLHASVARINSATSGQRLRCDLLFMRVPPRVCGCLAGWGPVSGRNVLLYRHTACCLSLKAPWLSDPGVGEYHGCVRVKLLPRCSMHSSECYLGTYTGNRSSPGHRRRSHLYDSAYVGICASHYMGIEESRRPSSLRFLDSEGSARNDGSHRRIERACRSRKRPLATQRFRSLDIAIVLRFVIHRVFVV